MVIHAPQEEEVTSLREMEMKLRDPGQWFSLQNKQNQKKKKAYTHRSHYLFSSSSGVFWLGVVWFALLR